MAKTINWSKGIFQCYYILSSGGKLIGRLRENSLSRTSSGNLGDREYCFRTFGVLKQQTKITHAETDEAVAQIIYNCWRPGATIHYNDQIWFWRYSNIFEPKWKITNNRDRTLSFQGTSVSGKVIVQDEDVTLALIGLYISNYYWQLIVLIVAVLIPSALMTFML